MWSEKVPKVTPQDHIEPSSSDEVEQSGEFTPTSLLNRARFVYYLFFANQ